MCKCVPLPQTVEHGNNNAHVIGLIPRECITQLNVHVYLECNSPFGYTPTKLANVNKACVIH